MARNNAGLQRLVALKDHLFSMKGNCPAFDIWHEQRWETIEEALDRWCRDSAMNQFIDKYADSLADDLFDLLNTCDVSVAADAAMDIMEELFAQAREVHRVASVPAEDACLPSLDPPDYAVETADTWAEAA